MLFTPILSTTVPYALGEHEPETVLAYLYLVSVAQVDSVDPDAVDVCPVQAPHVANPVPVVSAHDLRVFARDGDVVEEDAALLSTADTDNVIAQVVHPASCRALYLIHLYQCGPFGAAKLDVFAETRRVGDGALAKVELGAAFGTVLHRRRDFGPTLRTLSHLVSSSPSNIRARCSGGSATAPRSTSSARIRSILPCRILRL